ncbi:MAG: sulfatase-like hydrolase/transferase [Verrucomicrobiales bacterium]|nr:sulfatase-like hydrolase/transferase [Verrucomicrobiales bacterium]
MKFVSLLSAYAFTLTTLTSGGDWIELFDGKTLDGWNARGEVETLSVVDGEIHLLAKNNVWVVSDRVMGDFEATVEVLLPGDAAEAKLNSGLAFRLTGAEGKPKGYQCEIEAPSPGRNGGVYGIGLGGWLYPANDQAKEFGSAIKGVIKDGEWNTYRVVCRGPVIETFVNGKPISRVEDSQSLKGFFGFQHHGKGGTVRFRNLKARELPSPTPVSGGEERPNIVWITAEDMSPTLGCYGDKYANTPNLDAFAKESVRYTHAFAAAPVCSPSRSTLITGMWAPSLGTSQMRSGFPIPAEVKGFPSYLREAGYFTTNRVKTDYNTADANRLIEESWNASTPEAHWRSDKREKGQPFFSVFNHMTSHQSRTMVWPYEAFQEHVQSELSAEEVHDPDKAPIPPYYPDTETVRKTVARFYDCVTVMDKQVGRLLAELEEDDQAENTIVFFYSDHGSGMPRHKRLLHDSGMHVPLMIRFPEKWKHLAPAAPGETLDRLVTFVDYPATVLSLLGLEVPDYMQGEIFLGKDAAPEPHYVYGFRDRVDEVFDMSRSIRSDRFLYIRNFLPHQSWNPPSVFSDLGKIRRDITAYAAINGDKLTVAQRHYAGPTRPVEEFYDTEADPHNVNNLALGDMSGEIRKALDHHRAMLAVKRMEILDTGAIPETVMADFLEEEGAPMRTITTGGTNHRPDLDAAWAAADKVGFGTKEELLELLDSGDDYVRFWGIIGLRHLAHDDQQLLELLYDSMDDVSAPVRIEMASWMAHASENNRLEALRVLGRELENANWWTALRACRALELLGEKARPMLPFMKRVYRTTRNSPGDQNFFLAFSSGAFLEKLGEKTEPWDFTPKAGSFSADPPPKKEE